MAVTFTQDAFEQIKSHSLKERPIEACGILTGPENSRQISAVVTCANVDENPRAAYTIHPKELLQVIDEIDATQGIRLAGFYHSHPFSEASPSNVDRDRAAWDRFIYAIYSIPLDLLKCYLWDDEAKIFHILDVISE
ncbi:cysO-cysteine peptidase [archaeon BMS3Abin16]|nr:cysO-cysteine peptidase [archaeon BMS3Abin16]HDY73755.1 M67 family peptidase [Euryarchaeota archaeon]